jgi:YD repeat-containing protein
VFGALLVLATVSCAGDSPETPIQEYRFDAQDRLAAVITPDGNRIRYRWNADGYLQDVRYRKGRIRYGYDPAGLLAWTEGPSGSVEYYRDSLGRVTDVLWAGTLTRLLHYEHDASHRTVGVAVFDLDRARRDGGLPGGAALPDGLPEDEADWRLKRAAIFAASDWFSKAGTYTDYRVRYEFDSSSRVVAVEGPGGRVAFSYAPSGRRLERRWPNGASTIEEFDDQGRPLNIEHRDPSGATLAAFGYAWGSRGELQTVTERQSDVQRSAAFRWDGSRLARVEPRDADPIQLEYDDAGRLAKLTRSDRSVEYSHDRTGQLTRSGDATWGLDVNGWPESLTVNGASLGITFDGRGLPTELRDGRTEVSIAFDPAGHLSRVKTETGERHFLADPLTAFDASLLAWDGSGRVVRSQVYGDQLLFERDAEGRTTYLLRDGLGNVRLAVDASGSVRTVGAPPWEAVGRVSELRHPLHSAPPRAERLGRWPFTAWTATLHAAQREDDSSDSWRLRDIDVAAMWSRFVTEEQYFRQAGFDSSYVAGRLYDDKIQNRFDRFLTATRSRSVTVYLKGISNGWAETTADTRFRCPAGDCVFMPTFGALPEWMHLPATVVEKTLMGLMPRKLDMPALIERARASGKSIDAIVCESGCGFELQRNVDDLERYARANPGVKLPVIMPQSTDIGPTLRARLERAGYVVIVVTEEDKIVPRVVASAADYVGIFGRIPLVGERLGLPIQAASALAFAGGELLAGRSIVGPHGTDDHWQGIQSALEPHRFPMKALRDVAPDELKRLWFDDADSSEDAPGDSPGDTTLPALERRLGGIELAVRGESDIDANAITGLAYDPAQGTAFLLGTRKAGLPSVRLADLAVAMTLAYRDPPVFPKFSLDPDDPSNPRGKWMKLVHYPEGLKGTQFGHTMFLADWLMKQLSFGLEVDSTGRITRRETMPAGLRDTFALTFDQPSRDDADVWTRMWIVANDFRWKVADDAVVFSTAQMGVKAKRQVVDPRSKTGLSDVEDAVDPASARFAKDLTLKYDEVGASVPEFARLTELAKLVAIARWMRDAGVKADVEWLRQQSQPSVEAIARVTALEDTREQKREATSRSGNRTTITTSVRRVGMFGGVDLTVVPTPAGTPGALAQSVEQAFQAAGQSRQFEVRSDDGVLVSTVLPINEQGMRLWRMKQQTLPDELSREYVGEDELKLVTRADGTSLELRSDNGRPTAAVERRNRRRSATFILDANGKVIRSEHASGIVEYRYDSNGRLTGVEHQGAGGRRSTWASTADGSTWTVTAPGYDAAQYRYDTNGALRDVSVEGPRPVSLATTGPSSLPAGAMPISSTSVGASASRRGPSTAMSVRRRPVTWVGKLFGNTGLRFEAAPYTAPAPTASSDPAELARIEEVRSLSTADTAFVYASRAGSQAEDLVRLQFGMRELTLRQADIDAFIATGVAPEGLESAFRDQRGLSRVIVLAPSTEGATGETADGGQLRTVRLVEAMNASWGQFVSVHLATDANLGLRNASRVPLVRGPQDVSALIPDESFQVTDYGLRDRIRMYLKEFGVGVADGPRVIERGNVLMISGHKDFRLAEYLTALGGKGALRDRYVLLFSCNDPGDVTLNARLIGEFGAAGVHFFGDAVHLQAVTDVIRELARTVAQTGQDGQTLDRLIRQAVDAAASRNKVRPLGLEILKLRRGITQISELHWRHSFQPA